MTDVYTARGLTWGIHPTRVDSPSPPGRGAGGEGGRQTTSFEAGPHMNAELGGSAQEFAKPAIPHSTLPKSIKEQSMTRRRRHIRPKPPVPLCPEHGVPMLVGRVVRRLQYRYCPIPGCPQSARTMRIVLGRPRKAKAGLTNDEPSGRSGRKDRQGNAHAASLTLSTSSTFSTPSSIIRT